MPKTSTKPIAAEKIDAEKIAGTADRGQDISGHFTNQFTVIRSSVKGAKRAFPAGMTNKGG